MKNLKGLKIAEKESKKSRRIRKGYIKAEEKAEEKIKQASNELNTSNIPDQQKYINKKSSEDLAAYAIEPNLEKEKRI